MTTPAWGPSRAIPSADGKALLVNVPIVANDDIDVLVEDVDAIRAVLERTLPDAVEASVTGPAGYSADASRVFDGSTPPCSTPPPCSSSCCS